MNRYCIVHIPEGEIETYFNTITSELDEKFNIGNLSKKIFQHITLRYPFEIDNEGILAIEEKIGKFLENKKTFNYGIVGFSKFSEDDKTIFLSISNDRNVCDFRQGLINEMEIEDTKGEYIENYHPHISIARDLTSEACKQVWEYVNNLPKPHFDLVFNNVAIIIKKDGVWNIYKKFNIN